MAQPVTAAPDLRPYLRERALIGGHWIESADGNTIPVRNPSTGEVIGHVPACGREEVARAIEAARAAFQVGNRGQLRIAPRSCAVLPTSWRLRSNPLRHC